MKANAFFTGRLWHRRFEPMHAFERQLLMAYVDVDEIDAAPRGVLRLASGWPISVRRRDHLVATDESGAKPLPLRDRVQQLVEPVLGRAPRGPMRLLTQPRMCGLTFDPVSFVYCLGQDGGELEAVVAEVTNTPWGERHVYVLAKEGVLDGGSARTRVDREGGALRATEGFVADGVQKALHVSPFFGMDQQYRFEFSAPADRMGLSIENRHVGERVFQAGLSLERVPESAGFLSMALLRHPVMPLETLIGIYVQALKLAWKGASFYRHPRALRAEAMADQRSSAARFRGTK